MGRRVCRHSSKSASPDGKIREKNWIVVVAFCVQKLSKFDENIEITLNVLSNINDDQVQSYQQLIAFYHAHKEKVFSKIFVELREWFSANLCAALGAILDEFVDNLNNVEFSFIEPQIESILQKNDFLTYFGKSQMIDAYMTTIRYQKLQPIDGKYFKNYVIAELMEGRITEYMNVAGGVKEKIGESICEIFNNAQMHSESKYIYSCGQFYPAKNKIVFTIVDRGIGFRDRINRTFGSHLNSVQAIKWAVKDKTTTKKISGGIGLAILREFVETNGGKMQIVSKDGFYQFTRGGEYTRIFQDEFPGTIVNLQFRTDFI